jgi:hypothetical protein
MIKHTVFFKLKHSKGSALETGFLKEALTLSAIPVVKNLECVRQTSPKNDFDYGLTMEFATEADYQFYNKHPQHVKFVNERWLKEVEKFLEIDYVAHMLPAVS